MEEPQEWAISLFFLISVESCTLCILHLFMKLEAATVCLFYIVQTEMFWFQDTTTESKSVSPKAFGKKKQLWNRIVVNVVNWTSWKVAESASRRNRHLLLFVTVVLCCDQCLVNSFCVSLNGRILAQRLTYSPLWKPNLRSKFNFAHECISNWKFV